MATEIQNATRNFASPLFVDHLTTVPPLIETPDLGRLIIFDAASSATLASQVIALTGINDNVRIPYTRIVADSVRVCDYKAAVAKVMDVQLVAAPVGDTSGRHSIGIESFTPGRQAEPFEKVYFDIIPASAGLTDQQKLQRIADKINADAQRVVNATVLQVSPTSTTVTTTTTTSTGAQVWRLRLTARVAGLEFQVRRGTCFSAPILVTANVKEAFSGRYVEATGVAVPAAYTAPATQLQGIMFQVEEDGEPLAKGDICIRRRTYTVLRDKSVAGALTKINDLLTILRGPSGATQEYVRKTAQANLA